MATEQPEFDVDVMRATAATGDAEGAPQAVARIVHWASVEHPGWFWKGV